MPVGSRIRRLKDRLAGLGFLPQAGAGLEGLRTENGVTVDMVVRSGQENPDSAIGVYAGDPESYRLFAPLLDPIISGYHQYAASAAPSRNLDPRDLAVTNLDPSGERILSTRIRVGRNLKGYAFSPAITAEARRGLERTIVDALGSLTGDLAGTYYPLADMDEATRAQLVSDHFLFKQGDRFLESAGINRDWPEGRGIFVSADTRFSAWVNEEDELRIISMQPGADLLAVFERLARAVQSLEQLLPFAYDERLGYLNSCPTNLGTALRASFHLALPGLSKRSDFKELCLSLGLEARGVDGEHSEPEGGVCDISNRRRLGINEVEAVQALHDGTKRLLELEQES